MARYYDNKEFLNLKGRFRDGYTPEDIDAAAPVISRHFVRRFVCVWDWRMPDGTLCGDSECGLLDRGWVRGVPGLFDFLINGGPPPARNAINRAEKLSRYTNRDRANNAFNVRRLFATPGDQTEPFGFDERAAWLIRNALELAAQSVDRDMILKLNYDRSEVGFDHVDRLVMFDDDSILDAELDNLAADFNALADLFTSR